MKFFFQNVNDFISDFYTKMECTAFTAKFKRIGARSVKRYNMDRIEVIVYISFYSTTSISVMIRNSELAKTCLQYLALAFIKILSVMS